jgi:AsmA-like C-terminal region
LRNLLGYLFTDKEVLNVEGDFVSRKLDLNTLLASDEKSGADTNYVFALPANVRMKLNTTVKEIQFRRFTASSFTGVFELRNRQLHLNDLNMRTLDGVVSGNGIVDATRDDSLLISFNSKIAQVNISKLFYTFENFGQKEGEETIGDKNVFGSLTANVEFVSMWDNKLNINEKKLFTFADITIDQGELKEFKPLESLSRFINIEELRDIKFSTLHNTIEIRDRVVNIPRMEIKSSAVDIIMSGTHDFDNMVDYHFVVSLDELRARKAKTKKENNEFGEVESDGNKRYKLYISMKGPVDNPEIKYLDAKGFIEQKKEELKQEKQNLKNILREEFGWFKKDTTKKDEEPEDEPVNPEGGTIKFKKGKDEEEAPEGEDF